MPKTKVATGDIELVNPDTGELNTVELVVDNDDDDGVCNSMTTSRVGKPTSEQLAKINKFSMKNLTEEDVFVFKPLMIDDQETSYTSVIHPNLLRTFMKNTYKGVGLLLNHDSYSLPVGRTFSAEIVEEYDVDLNKMCQSLYGEVYIALGRNTQSGMSTEDIVKGIESGTIFDVSIGFSAKKHTCSICGNDIRNYGDCPHYPGKEYSVDNEDGTSCVKKCQVIIGDDGNGELLELSLVYAGACDRATIKNSFSNNSVTNDESGTKLTIVDNIKSVPPDAKIYQYFSKYGSVFYTDAKEKQNLTESIDLRSEKNMEYLKLFNTKFGLNIETEEELTSKLDEMQTEMATSKEELVNTQTQLEEKVIELTNKEAEFELLKGEVTTKDIAIEALTTENTELKKSEEIANTYRNDLITSTIEAGVRAYGNAFQVETFTKFLNSISLDEIKATREGFNTEVASKFSGSRVSTTRDLTSNPLTNKEDFETEEEFRTHIADKAIVYARENEMSILEASKKLYKEFSVKRES
jgi:hypothetical protein